MRTRILLSLLIVAMVIVGYAFWPNDVNHDGGLKYVAIGIDENRSPVALGIKVKNDSDSDIEVIDCYAELTWTSLVASKFTPDNAPPRFSSETTFVDNAPIIIPANSTATIALNFRWKLDESAPPAVAACQIIPGLKTKDANVTTEPVMFIVTHNADDESIQKAGGFRLDTTKAAASDFINATETLEGKKSPRIQYLIKALRSYLDNDVEPALAPFT